MRIRVLSDLHLEVRAFDPPKVAADVVVLAGDIANGIEGIEWARRTFDSPVLYVPGNHEYYDGDIEAVRDALRNAAARYADGQVRLLDTETLSLAGIRFLGCTLWSDYSLLEPDERPASMARMQRYVPDYRVIGRYGRKFQPEDSAELCSRHRAWLKARLEEDCPQPTVVVTHFVPHRGSIAPQYENDIANPVFIVPLDELMGHAAAWIHGHTHTAFDYDAAGTRIVCNPRGYPREDTGFDPAKVIWIDHTANRID